MESQPTGGLRRQTRDESGGFRAAFSKVLRTLECVRLLPSSLVAVIASSAVPLAAATVSVAAGMSGTATLLFVAVGVAISATIISLGLLRPVTRLAVDAVLESNAAKENLRRERQDRAFRDRVDRALTSAQNESTTLGICLRAVAEVLPEADVSLLLNLPNEIRIGWQVRLVEGVLQPAVPVANTPSCVGLGTHRTAVSPSSKVMEACAHVQQSGGDQSSVCIPLSLGDRTLGAVSAVSAPGETPNDETLERLEWVVTRTAVRVAEQRLQRGPSIAGRTDGVTGLPGSAALRHQMRDLVRTLSPFTVAMVTVDSFDQIRDQHGEVVSDEVLRVAADSLCSTLRPDDLICRVDGPRFAAVLPDCSAVQATGAMERVRECLALAMSTDAGPPFTLSVGVVESHQASSLDELIELAENACEQACSDGGNRVAAVRRN